MGIESVHPEGWKRGSGYSNGMLAPAGARMLSVAGQVAWDAEQQLVGAGDFTAQFRQALENVVADLRAHRGSSLVVAGEAQPAAVHALAHAMNAALGNAGRTVIYTEPVELSPTRQHGITMQALVEEMNAGKVDVLIINDQEARQLTATR